MANIHQLNQDNVLGEEEELSPSAFPPDGESYDDEEVKTKKKTSLMPMIGGIAIALVMISIFGWKIVSPHLNRGKQADAFEPISANMTSEMPREVAPGPIDITNQHSAAPLPAEPAPGQIQPAARPQPQAMVGQSQPAPLLEPGGAPRSSALVPQAQPVANAGPATQTSLAVAPAPVQQVPVANEELMRVNQRIDGLEKSIASIQEAVNKLTVNSASLKPKNVAVKSVVARPVTATVAKVAPKPAATLRVAAVKPQIIASPSERESAPIAEKADLTSPRVDVAQRPGLKAVLEGRAWFQTKSGESITVTPGEEVPGVGVVKFIDIDRGEVRFANGVVIH